MTAAVPPAMSDPVSTLYANIGNLPDDELNSINLLPFAVEGDEVNALKRKICQAIVNVFKNAGYPMELGAYSSPSRSITVACRSCSEPLITATVDDTGYAAVPAAQIIDGMSVRSTACPHNVLTLDDQRRLIEQAAQEAQ